MAKNFKDFIDRHGLIVQADDDGGDTLQRTAMYYYALKYTRNVEFDHSGEYISSGLIKALRKLEHPLKAGIYVRHPDFYKWYSKTSKTSRDQLLPLIIALGAYGMRKRLYDLLWAFIKRFGFAQNTEPNGDSTEKKIPDLLMPQHWGTFIRAFYSIWLSPILIATDLFLVIDALVKVGKSHVLKEKESDDLNLFLMLHQAKKRFRTPLASLAIFIYQEYRWRSPVWAFQNYFREETGAPPFFDVMLPLLYDIENEAV